MFWEPLGTPVPPKARVRNFIHPVQLGIFPKRLSLPYPVAEILSRYEENVSSIRDGFSAWVKSDPETILQRHIVDAKGANPSFREAATRKQSPSNEEYRFDADVPNRLIEQKKAEHLQLEPTTSTWKRSHRKTHCKEAAHHHPSRISRIS